MKERENGCCCWLIICILDLAWCLGHFEDCFSSFIFVLVDDDDDDDG